MESLSKLKCIKGNQAERLCATHSCKHFSIMCGTSKCECNKPHIKCFLNCSIESLKQMLAQKASLKNPHLVLIEEWIVSRIKQLTVQLQSIRLMVEQPELPGIEGKVFKLMQQGKSQDISSELVSKLVESLRKQQQINIDLKPFKKIIEKETINFNNVIKNVIDLLIVPSSSSKFSSDSSVKINVQEPCYKFSTIYCNKYIQLNNYDRTATSIQGQYWKSVFFYKSVEQIGNFMQIYELKIRKTSDSYFRFGLCHFNNVQKGMGDLTVSHCYLIRAEDGSIVSYLKQPNPSTYNPITKVQLNEVFKVVYSPKNQIVQFLNVNKNQRTVINTKKIKGDPMYFCVQFYQKKDEVELTGFELVQQ